VDAGRDLFRARDISAGEGDIGCSAAAAGPLLDQASKPADMDLPGFGLHPLKGDLKGFWSVAVNRNWRVMFRFDDQERPTLI
jgi:RelE-like toxin of type II toxin-antitoxin system HigB